jgi:hypothetical protein
MSPHAAVTFHRQWYEDSCAASGMEILLKTHDMVAPDFREFQDRYQNMNVGFEKTFELEPHLFAQDEELPQSQARARIKEEAKKGRYPLVSLPSGHRQGTIVFHIFIADLVGEALVFRSRYYGDIVPIEMADDAALAARIDSLNRGLIKFCYYDFSPIKPG